MCAEHSLNEERDNPVELSRDTMFLNIVGYDMDNTNKRHILSFAPEFGIYDSQLDQTYHYTSYQLCLQKAARSLGHNFSIVAPTTCSTVSESVVPLLSPPPSSRLSSEIAEFVDRFTLEHPKEDIVILLYEGSLALASEFSILARRFPFVFFVLNLFLSEPDYNLDIAFRGYLDTGIKESPDKLQPSNQAFFPIGGNLAQTANFVVFAETEAKRFAASLLGISEVRQWRTFSAISGIRKTAQNQNYSSNRYRVLVPLSSWQIGEGLVNEMIAVKKETDAHRGHRAEIEFHVTGYHPDPEVQHLLARLGDSGFEITSESRSMEDYVEMYSSHDVVWLPNRYYILQSSGKALDALVQGTPIIAPVGTYGWREQNRWLGGAPGYSTRREVRDLFLNLQFILPAVASELKRQNETVRDYYSPINTIRGLVSATEK